MNIKLGARSIETLKPSDKPYEARDSELTGLLIRVQPSGVMTYYADYRNSKSERKRVKLGRVEVLSINQARDMARTALGDAAKGLDPAAERKHSRQMTLKVFLDTAYGQWVNANIKHPVQTLDRLKRQFSPFLSNRLDEITAWKIERWIADRKKGGIKNTTVNRNVGMLKAALSKAVEWKILTTHPLASVKPQKIDSSKMVRYLNPDERERLLNALDKREQIRQAARQSGNVWRIERNYIELPTIERDTFSDHLKPMVLISLNTGLRQGELFSLEWNDVDLKSHSPSIIIQGSKAKSGQTRHIPLNKTAFDTFTKLKRQSDANDRFVFSNIDGNKFNNVKKSWANLLKNANIQSFRWHDMRHDFASRLVQNGTDLNTVRALLGHKDITMTLRYAHLSPKVMADAVAKLAHEPTHLFNNQTVQYGKK